MTVSKPGEVLAHHLKMSGIKFDREVCLIPKRKYRFDFVLPHGILIEVQGGLHLGHLGGHSSKKGILRDMDKSNLATFHGYRLLCFDSGAVYSGSAIAMIQDLLHKLKDEERRSA